MRDENIDFQAPEALKAAAKLPVSGMPLGGPVVGKPVDEKAVETVVSQPPIVAWLRGMTECLCLPFAKPPSSLPMPTSAA